MRPQKGDPQFGPVCTCGGPKAKQAKTCQPCHGISRGYKRPLPSGDPMALTRKLEQARRDATGELAELVASQLDDELFGSYSRERWTVTLDDGLYEVTAA